MPPQQGDIQHQWFINGDGIDRHVITADIQRYLGNDATVRPGVGTGDNQGTPGYWIKAYRNLTNAMIADLRADSSRWRQEQRNTGTRAPYVESDTYQQGSASVAQQRQNPRNTDRDSPLLDQYGRDRRPGPPIDAMEGVISPGQSQRYANQAARSGPFPPDSRGPESRGGYPPDRNYQQQPQYSQDMPMADNWGRIPIDQNYSRQPGFPGQPGYPPNDAPSGYVRQGDYYVPITTGYVTPGGVATAGPGAQQYPPGQQPYPQQQPRRDPYDQQNAGRGRDDRYGQPPQDYSDSRGDPRYAYPSPATTVAAPNPDWPPSSSYPQQPPFDQRNRPIQSPGGQPGGYPPGQPQYPPQSNNPANYNKPGQPTAEERERERRRRRN